jgi:hypothetical protein
MYLIKCFDFYIKKKNKIVFFFSKMVFFRIYLKLTILSKFNCGFIKRFLLFFSQSPFCN